MPKRPVRLPPLKPEEHDQAGQDFLASVRNAEALERGSDFNMPATFARHPELSAAIFEFSRKVGACAGITMRLREIVIMRVAWRSQADYEWGQHNRSMRRVGLGAEYVEPLKTGAEAAIWAPDERAALRLVDSLHDTREVSDELWAELNRHFSVRQVLDILILIGQYEMLAGAFNAVGLRLEDDFAEFAIENS
jgi:alkylhydroperoxidase family enzyme